MLANRTQLSTTFEAFSYVGLQNSNNFGNNCTTPQMQYIEDVSLKNGIPPHDSISSTTKRNQNKTAVEYKENDYRKIWEGLV